MRHGDQVVHIHTPWTHGLGTITGTNPIGWPEVQWTTGEHGAYPPQHLEIASTWEHQQVNKALASL